MSNFKNNVKMYVGGYAHTSASTHGGQKRASLELELQVAMSHLRGCWDSLGSSLRAVPTLNHTHVEPPL